MEAAAQAQAARLLELVPGLELAEALDLARQAVAEPAPHDGAGGKPTGRHVARAQQLVASRTRPAPNLAHLAPAQMLRELEMCNRCLTKWAEIPPVPMPTKEEMAKMGSFLNGIIDALVELDETFDMGVEETCRFREEI